MAFPISPTNNQTTTVNGIVYVYSSTDNAWSRLSSPLANLTVTANLVSSGNLIASNISVASLFWANGAVLPLTGTYSNTNVSAYLSSTSVSIKGVSVTSDSSQSDALNLNNNNIYGVNTIRINDPGTSEGITWEGGSGWYIYESPNNLSNDIGNLQVVLNGTRSLTVDTNSTVDIPSTWEATSTSTGALRVGGGVGIGGNLWVGGNVYTANLIAISSTNLSVTDPLLYLTASNPSPYNYDIGFFSHFVGGSLSRYQHTGFSRNYQDNTWTLFSNVFTEPGVTISWTEANIIYDPIKVGSANIANTTVSTSTTTGALVVRGGVGIAGALYIGNTGDVSANIGAFINSVNAFRTYANTKIGDNTNSNLVVRSTADSTTIDTGALVVAGGVGVSGNIYTTKIYTTEGIYWNGNGEPLSSGGGSSTLDGLTDVVISGATPGQVLKYNGSEWVNGTDNTGSGGGGGGSGITFTADSVPPLSANVADQWYDTATDILLEYINDGDSTQWVDISSGPIAANTRLNLSSGNLQVVGYVLPALNNTYDLGSGIYSWRNLTITNRATVGNITTTNGIFYSNGASASYANTRVAEYLPVYSGNVSSDYLIPTPANSNVVVGSGNLLLSTGSNLVIRDGYISAGDTGLIGVTNSTLSVINGNLTINTGSVGIGTTTPAGSLEVTGDVLISNNGNLTVSGNIVQQEAYYEIYGNVDAIGGNLTCDFTSGTIFNVTSISSNVTANFTNVSSLSFGATAATIVIKQAATAYIVSNIQINGVMQTVYWANGIGNQSAPAGLANNTDVISFSLLHLGNGTWRVLGQLGSYA